MCRSIEYEGYREAGCGMLVVEAMEGLAAVVVGCSLFSPLSPLSPPRLVSRNPLVSPSLVLLPLSSPLLVFWPVSSA